jgi:hypothetical protein
MRPLQPRFELRQPAHRLSSALDEHAGNVILLVEPERHRVGRSVPVEQRHEVVRLANRHRDRSSVLAPVIEVVLAVKVPVPMVPAPAAEEVGLAGAALLLEPDARPARQIRLSRHEIPPFAGLAKILYDADSVLLRGTRDENREE